MTHFILFAFKVTHFIASWRICFISVIRPVGALLAFRGFRPTFILLDICRYLAVLGEFCDYTGQSFISLVIIYLVIWFFFALNRDIRLKFNVFLLLSTEKKVEKKPKRWLLLINYFKKGKMKGWRKDSSYNPTCSFFKYLKKVQKTVWMIKKNESIFKNLNIVFQFWFIWARISKNVIILHLKTSQSESWLRWRTKPSRLFPVVHWLFMLLNRVLIILLCNLFFSLRRWKEALLYLSCN